MTVLFCDFTQNLGQEQVNQRSNRCPVLDEHIIDNTSDDCPDVLAGIGPACVL